MDKRMEGLKAYLDASVSVYHAVAELEKNLQAAGYACLREGNPWAIVPGGKYYLTRGGTALVAFRIPEGEAKGFLMSASHSDRPTFKIKENGQLTGKYTRLATEKYGGMLMSTWADRPLSIAGRVLVETETGAESVLVNIDRDLLMIPNVAIHMNRKANEGFEWNPTTDTVPLMGGKEAEGKLEGLLQKQASGKILGSDLYLYLRQKATAWGLEEEYISSAALDDLMCAWCCTQGFLEAKTGESVPVLCVFDSEEVGSSSVQGACSDLLETTLSRICKTMGWELEQMLSRSFMISADNAHAVHPNHPEYADANNAPQMNGGIVLKFNANLRYATDGLSAAVLRKVCGKADVPVQTFYNRADLPGGSTLGSLSLAHVAVPTADIGLAQLAMHSAYETAGTKDALYLIAAMESYYGSTFDRPTETEFTLH